MPLTKLYHHIKSRLFPECPVKAQFVKRITLISTACLAAPVMASLVWMPDNDMDSSSEVNNFRVSELTLPFSAQTPGEEPAETQPSVNTQDNWHTVQVKRNDSLGDVFERAGAGVSQAYQFASSSKQAKKIAGQLKPGKELMFLFDQQGEWQKFRVIENKLLYTEVSRLTQGYRIEDIHLTPDIIYHFAQATINNSLFESANEAGLDDRLTMKLASIFGWDVDFALDIRNGDSFHIVYEELFLQGERIGSGEIVAAEFRNQEKTYQAVRYTDSNGDSNYFTPEGDSMRKAFLRTPVDFARISSPFNLKRKHPILHTIRAHKGTDYAAAPGTPIRVTGAGTVRFKGIKGGYGKTIMVQHGHSYETLYAHMSGYARGISNGAKVKQGQIIGYVGSSGLATGPHLHYEFHVNGIERNPVTVQFPKTASINADDKPLFYAQTSKYLMQLASYLGQPAGLHVATAE